LVITTTHSMKVVKFIARRSGYDKRLDTNQSNLRTTIEGFIFE